MKREYQIAQVNIARLTQAADHPANADFFAKVDEVNKIAESHEGFVWRYVEDGESPSPASVFGDAKLVVNMSIWADINALMDFVYRDKEHKEVMRRRKAWFDTIDVHMALWWIKAGRIPNLDEAKLRLDLLKAIGPSYSAFTFKQIYAVPAAESLKEFRT